MIAIGLVALLFFSSGGSNGSPSAKPSPEVDVANNELFVSRSDYGRRWPLTVSSGVLRCDEPGEVTFTAPDGTTYWVNGTAGNAAALNEWYRIDPIWKDDPADPYLKISIGPLIDDGLALCAP